MFFDPQGAVEFCVPCVCVQVLGLSVRPVCVDEQVHPCDTGAHLYCSVGSSQC